ncbi:MAG: serine/threonine-protein phosphatase [Eubacterium sp.]|nr:serine/threonine-protein phosphatase [Eubacterium sp.]MCR5291526.1 serine/threonine-protein phosphatase [Eubacterium sp.]
MERRNLSYRIGNLQGVGARKRQEDSFSVMNAFDAAQIMEQGLFFTVCDGMGGMKDGKLASETAVASLRASFTDMDRRGDISAQLKEACYRASDKVEEIIGGSGGSTTVTGVIFKEKLYFASVGDSYFFLLRDKKLYKLNHEHNLLHEKYLQAIKGGYPNPKDYEGMNEAEALTQFLGMIGLSDVDGTVRPIPLKEGDVLMACSDGVGGVLTEDEVRRCLSFVSERSMCQQIEQFLVAHARKNQDNYTALIVKCE